MRYHCTDAYGVSEPSPSPDRMKQFIDSVFEADDADFPDVSLIHESGWRLTYSSEKTMVLDNVETNVNGVMIARVPPEKAHALWILLAQGELKVLRSEGWKSLPE